LRGVLVTTVVDWDTTHGKRQEKGLRESQPESAEAARRKQQRLGTLIAERQDSRQT
jgi:hypothetical protein